MKKNFLLILVLASLPYILHAQINPVIDSLEKNWEKSSCDTCKVNSLNDICKFYSASNFEKAKKYSNLSTGIAIKTGFKKGLASSYNNLANAYFYSANYSKALELHQKALSIRKTIGDKKGIGASLLGIGNVHYAHQNYDLAREYMNKSLVLLKEVKFDKGVRIVMSCLGNVALNKKEYDLALELFSQVAVESEKANDIGLFCSSTNGVGLVYFRKNDYDNAKPRFLKSFPIQLQINDLMGASATTINLGMIYSNQGKYDSALLYLHNGEDIAAKIGARDWQKNVYNSLGKTYFKKKMYKEAFEYYSKYSNLNDSLISESKDKAISELEIKYKTKEILSQKEIAEKKVSIEKLKALDVKIQAERKLVMVIFIAALIFVVLIVVYLFYRSKQKEKQSKLQAEEQLLRHRAVLEAEEKERIRIARDLHDGLGQTLSTARINASGLENIIGNDHLKIYQNTLQLIDKACAEVRDISHNMMPEALTRLGFLPAVRELANKISESGLLKVTIYADNFPEKLGEKFDISLYRIIQEVLSNMIRHAEAKQIKITLSNINNSINLKIEDDGIGFDVNKIETSDGIGWKNIFFRVLLLNGKIYMQSQKGKGTGINIDVILT